MNDLEELKSLLFGAEKQTLDTLTERVQHPETRAADIADVLPEAVRLSHRSGNALVAELRDPVGRCLKVSIQETPQEYADALYPVMGPAIRKSITETLKAFTQQINQAVEHSLSAKGLKWRIQAIRAGIPFGDFVVQQSLLYRVEQAYLISRVNGLLVSHVHHDASRIKDSDAVSAMFTAIQDFVKESFSPDRTGRLEVADMGEFALWAVHGPHALLVCVIRGVPAQTLRADLTAILERIHFRYGDQIRAYKGDTSSMQGVEEELSECLRFQARQESEHGKRKISAPLLLTLIIVAGFVAYFSYTKWQQQQELERLANVVDATPGIFISQIAYDEGAFTLSGLRDPLATSEKQIARIAGLEPQRVISDLRPYRSLDPEIVYRRAEIVLNPPESVALAASDAGILISGRAPQRWIEALYTKIDANAAGMPVSIGKLDSIEWLKLEASAAEMDGAQFFFSAGEMLIPEDALRLEQFAASLKPLLDEASRQGAHINVQITGFSDGTGRMKSNSTLSSKRAEASKSVLVDAGISGASIMIGESIAVEPSGKSDPSLRHVTIGVEIHPE